MFIYCHLPINPSWSPNVMTLMPVFPILSIMTHISWAIKTCLMNKLMNTCGLKSFLLCPLLYTRNTIQCDPYLFQYSNLRLHCLWRIHTDDKVCTLQFLWHQNEKTILMLFCLQGCPGCSPMCSEIRIQFKAVVIKVNWFSDEICLICKDWKKLY